MANAPEEKIAVVGGGIAGLFCALILQQNGRSVSLFETSNRLGGRIRTIRLDKKNEPLNAANWTADDLEFYVEFGPMRIELDKQLLLKALLTHLGITPKPAWATQTKEPYLVEFPAYTSPTSSQDPQYELSAEEVGKTPLQLLRLALLRVIAHLEVKGKSDFARKEVEGKHDFAWKKEQLIQRITLAAATQESVDGVFVDWMKDLEEDDYWEIQTKGQIAIQTTKGRTVKVPLYAMGFWNLLSDYLSHSATTKLRDLGTFYHLLPENPNAAEWLVWWLLGFAISEKLQGVFGGMECIVDKLVQKLAGDALFTDCWVKGIEVSPSKKLRLVFDDKKRPENGVVAREYDGVILALPKRALQDIENQSSRAFEQEQDIEHQSPRAFEREKEIKGLLDSTFAFPMVKTFVVVKNRWWEEDNMANRYATQVPTRELHYWKGSTKDSKQGLIMVYTDRPASSFWANYVPPGPQIDAHRSDEKPLPERLQDRLKRKVAQYLSANNLPDITPEDIVWYGIRDWGRGPYGGANHAWRPERKYWVVMRRLADIPVSGPSTDTPSIHICGEAYSDYHGFMEGSLRSAVYVLHRILDKKPDGEFERLPWLLEENSPEVGNTRLGVKGGYLEALRSWAAHLDSVEPTEPYLDE
jgi:monoamine oxidase